MESKDGHFHISHVTDLARGRCFKWKGRLERRYQVHLRADADGV